MALGRRKTSARQPEAEAPEATLARVRERLEMHLDIARTAGGKDASVSVRHVLDLLNPSGIWRLVRDEKVPGQPELPGNIDPMTGCLPVTPETR